MHELRFPAAVLALSALVSTACGDSSTATADEVEVVRSTAPVKAKIGAAGGELRAPVGHVLEGVIVTIPAGALAADTELTLEATIDAAPLDLKAERVGPQVQVLPAGLVLAVPASITVPIDDALLGPWGQSTATCAVWQRQGEGWTKLTQTSSSPTTVTVQSTSLATVAAGILLSPTAFCRANPFQCQGVQIETTICAAPAGFYCIRKLPDLTKPLLDGTAPSVRVSDDGQLHYIHSPAAGSITVARYSLVNGATSLLEATPVSGPLTIKGDIEIEADGSAWVATGSGNIRFRPTGTQVFDGPSGSLGVAVVGGVTTRFFRRTVTSKTGVTQNRLCAAPSNTCANLPSEVAGVEVKGRPGAGGQSFAALSTHGLAVFSTLSLATPLLFSGIVPPMEKQLNFATSAKSTALGLLRLSFTENGAIELRRLSDLPGTTVTLATQMRDVVFLEDDLLAAYKPDDASIAFLAGDGSLKTQSLAEEGSTDAVRMLPRSVLRIPGSHKLIVVTRGVTAGSPEIYELRPGG